MQAKPQGQHQWLQALSGRWTYESEAMMGPNQPSEKFRGTETVRSLGDLWVLCEGQGDMPDGDTASTVMTLGYDSHKESYVGTWIGSMMSYLWIYDGEMDANQRVLTLNATGPDMTVEGKMKRYRDVIEIKGDDLRTLTSYILSDDGQWHQFMTTTYHRQA